MAGHTTWRTTRHRRLGQGSIHPDPAYTEAYQAAQEALRLGQRVYDRRTELGLTQAELAQRAGMTQPQVSRLETGGATPTLPLLRRLATALEADVVIYSDSDSDGIGFTPHSNAA